MMPVFNSWTIIFLLAAAQGFFIAFVLWRWKRGVRQGNRLLACLLALFSLSMLEYVLYWTGLIINWPHFSNLSANFPILYGALIWLYLRTIYEDKPLTRTDLWHLFPFVLCSLPFLPWYFAATSVKQQHLASQSPFDWLGWPLRIQFWARMAHLAGFAAWNCWYISKQPKVGDTTRWAWAICSFQVVFALAYMSYFFLIQFPFFSLTWDYHISAVMTVMIYLIAYAGYVQPAVFDGLNWTEANTPAKYRNSGLTPEASRTLLEHLELLMLQERIYHDPEINLDKLAKLLDASKHHVSQVINEHLGMSFFEYVNLLRVNEARNLLAESTRSDLHVIEVAYSVGFNNKTSFNAAFKKATGMTPTEYRKNHGTSDTENGQPQEAQ
jgi:AraC-like DNA-binding protein